MRSYLLSARNPRVERVRCTFMVSILSLSLRILLTKSAFARRWLSSVSCSSFCAAEYRSNQTWAAGRPAKVLLEK